MTKNWFHQGRVWGPLLGGLLVLTLAGHSPLVATAQSAGDNPIVLENQQPGSPDWGWSLLGNDTTGQIKGYASATSVLQNESITFHVTVNPAQTYTIDFFRIGWYEGLGARHRLHVGPLAGVQQPPCDLDSATGLIACNWDPSYTLTVPGDWTSGVYTARLTNAEGYQNYVIFVVRDGRPAPFLYQQSVTTDHAYNNYPNDGLTGKSLYGHNSYGANTVSGGPRAVKVSFDRPLADSGLGNFLHWEINLIRWLERSGYDVTYSTNLDTHANGSELLNHKAFLSAGHDEYWSKEMFDAAEAARDAGVNLAFFGANAVYWQVRFEPSALGEPNRVMVGYKQRPLNPIDPVQGPTTSTEFRDPPVNRPEQTLMGIMFTAELPNGNADYVVTNSAHWVYAGTGFRDGDVVPGIVGYEADAYLPNYPPPSSTNHTLLSHSPITDSDTGESRHANSSMYQAPSGAWVFASGTMSWSWALDDLPGGLSHFVVDARIQRATANILNAFLNGGPPDIPSVTPTISSFTPSTGPVAAGVTIIGTNFSGATAVTFNGTAASFTVTSDTAIQATVPIAATTGPLSVTTPGGTATSAASFSILRTGDNPIILENQQPGSSDWGWSRLGDDVTGQIKGYASTPSVQQNAGITFRVSVNPAQTFTIDFFRLGWYEGLGARHRLQVGPLAGVQQRACEPDSTTGLIACNWDPSYTLTVPSDWTSGVYLARLTNASGFQNYVIFAVRDGRPASFLYQQSVATDHAYNNYPNDGLTGKSLHDYNSYGANTVSGDRRAVKVSFDRPLADSGLGNLLYWELNLIRWLERSGYDVTYSTSLDTHANGGELRNHKAFLSAGHDQSWSKEMFDAAEAARDAGVNLAFFGANAVYWQVRFEPSAVGLPNRVMVGYKQRPWNPIDPVQGPTTTGHFREPPVNRPEQTLMGTMFTTEPSNGNADYIVTNSAHWVYAGTGFRDGDVVPGMVGYLADSFMSNYPPPNSANHSLLSLSPVTDSSTGESRNASSSIYQAPSGAWVFASGTMSWSWALDDLPGGLSHFVVDSRIQRATANILDAFSNSAPPTPAITSFTPTSGPVGTGVTISGTNLTGATAVTFNGTASSFTVTSDTAIQATAPPGATTGPLTVTTPGGTAPSAATFTVVHPPTITSFAPTIGPVGTSVTISGTNFTGATAVRFNGTAAGFSVISATMIQATAPPGATTGPLSVTAPGGTAASAANFTVVHPPTITSFAPTIGPVGTSVTISGTNFTGATAVRFNGTAAGFSVISATTIQATAPPGATTGPLSVTTPGGTAASAANFTVVHPPTIASFTPTNGLVGASVTISGTNFSGATSVRFNGIAANFSVTSATTIQATVPAGATTGPLSVTTPDGTATSASVFTVMQRLTVTKTGLLGSGTVTSSPGGINCGATCSTNFAGGTVVTLTATPAFLSVFTGWSGCETVSGNKCTVRMTAAKQVTANFLP